MRILTVWFLIASAPLAISTAGCAGTLVRPEMNQTTAEIVVRGGAILTLDPRHPVVEALAIRGGRIARSGTNEEIAPLIGPSTQLIDLHDKAVVPGFIDCHRHIGLGSFPAPRVVEVGLPKEALLSKLASEGRNEPDLPLVLSGWVPVYYGGSRDDLDAISSTRPIIVMALDGHTAWLSSAAIRWLGVEDAPDPSPADEALRDSNARLTGLFRGAGWTVWIRNRAAELSAPAGVGTAIKEELEHAAAIGLTSAHNMSFSFRVARLLADLADRGELPLRIRELPYGHDTAMVSALRALRPSHPDMFRMSAVKYILDGAPISGNGSYRGCTHSAPIRMSPQDIRRVVTDHTQRGEQVAFHAIGQDAVHAAIDAIEAAGASAIALRPRIEHADFVDPSDEEKLARLGVVLSMQPGHFIVTRLPGSEGVLVPPFSQWGLRRHFVRSVPVCFGSDGPDTPLQSIAAAMRGPTAAEAISFDEALAAHTRSGAFASREEDEIGTLEEGKRADLVVLSADPRGLSPDQVSSLVVERTIVGGRTTFRRIDGAASTDGSGQRVTSKRLGRAG